MSRLLKKSPGAQRRLGERALERQLREELLAGSRYLRPRLEKAGYHPIRFRTRRDLGTLPLTDLPTLTGVRAEDLWLRPSPRAMKELWPFGRKLAMSMTGKRAQGILEHAYAPVLATVEEGLPVTWTAGDLDLTTEQGSRFLSLCGVTAGSRVSDRLGEEPTFGRFCLRRGAEALGATLVEEGAEFTLLEEEGPVEGTPILLGSLAHEGPAARWYPVGPARVAFFQLPGSGSNPQVHFFPDLTCVEKVDEELVVTNLAYRGTALLRYRTGLAGQPDWTRADGALSLPRIQSFTT